MKKANAKRHAYQIAYHQDKQEWKRLFKEGKTPFRTLAAYRDNKHGRKKSIQSELKGRQSEKSGLVTNLERILADFKYAEELATRAGDELRELLNNEGITAR